MLIWIIIAALATIAITALLARILMAVNAAPEARRPKVAGGRDHPEGD